MDQLEERIGKDDMLLQFGVRKQNYKRLQDM